MVGAATREFGPPRGLVKKASSAMISKKIQKMEGADMESCFQMAVGSAFHGCGAVAPAMRKNRKGKIVNISSGFGLRAGRDIYMYCCSKGGLIQLTRVLSFNLARFGITANTIVPGFIPTSPTDSDIRGTLPRSGH